MCWMVVCKSVLTFSPSGRVFVNIGVHICLALNEAS